MPAGSLAETQRIFWTLITAPEGAAAGLWALDAHTKRLAETMWRGDERLSALERLDIYADMYFYRLRDCLRGDFPAVAAVLGEARFHNLVTDYVLARPPRHFSLRFAGQQLPAFIRGHAVAETAPFLRDLADLEWAIVDAFDAPDAPVLAADRLAAVPAEEWADLRFGVTPSLQLLRCDWAVHTTWQEVNDGCQVRDPEHRPTWLRVWRQDLRVFHRQIDAIESAALLDVLAGLPFAQVCDRIAAEDPADAAPRAFGLVASWLQDGLVTRYTA
jgi:hypothetical protein